MIALDDGAYVWQADRREGQDTQGYLVLTTNSFQKMPSFMLMLAVGELIIFDDDDCNDETGLQYG